MKFKIKREIRGRIRLQNCQKKLSCEQADALQYYLSLKDPVESVNVQERTGNIVIRYTGERENILRMLREFRLADVKVPEECRQSSRRRLNQEYGDKLINRIVLYYGGRLFIPYPLRAVLTAVKSIKYTRHGLETLAKGKIEVPVLDGTAIDMTVQELRQPTPCKIRRPSVRNRPDILSGIRWASRLLLLSSSFPSSKGMPLLRRPLFRTTLSSRRHTSPL